MRYLVIDNRFRAPVHVFLEQDPTAAAGPLGLAVRKVELEPVGDEKGGGRVGSGEAVGQDPRRTDQYRQFGSDGAATRAGYGLIEPRYVGPSWEAYDRMFGFGSRKVMR